MRNEEGIEKIGEIISRRLDGEAITVIADSMGVSRQYIHSIIACFPKGKFSYLTNAEYESKKTLYFDIAIDYFFLLPSRLIIKRDGLEPYADEAILKVAEKYNMNPLEVKNIFHRISCHHKPLFETPYYQNVVKWQKYNNVSLTELAKMLRMSPIRLQGIFRGWYHMSLRTANNINKLSGLTIYDIYKDLFDIDKKEHPDEYK